jgi:hypothetical protein
MPSISLGAWQSRQEKGAQPRMTASPNRLRGHKETNLAVSKRPIVKRAFCSRAHQAQVVKGEELAQLQLSALAKSHHPRCISSIDPQWPPSPAGPGLPLETTDADAAERTTEQSTAVPQLLRAACPSNPYERLRHPITVTTSFARDEGQPGHSQHRKGISKSS